MKKSILLLFGLLFTIISFAQDFEIIEVSDSLNQVYVKLPNDTIPQQILVKDIGYIEVFAVRKHVICVFDINDKDVGRTYFKTLYYYINDKKYEVEEALFIRQVFINGF